MYIGALVLEALQNLLFELAGADRLAILLELKNGPLRISYLSKKLDFTVQETSRNVLRLVEAKLISKDAEGCFHLTPYGEETIDLLEGFSFLSKYNDYFATHTLSNIPKEFSYSLASLKGCQLVDDVMIAFSNVENMIQKAYEYIWILSNQILVSTMPHLEEALKRGVEFRLLLPLNVTPPKKAVERMCDSVNLKAIKEGRLQARFLEKVDVLICLSEKEVAALGFLSTEGKIDYHGFRAEDDLSFKWTKALFSHYWNLSISREPEFLFNKKL